MDAEDGIVHVGTTTAGAVFGERGVESCYRYTLNRRWDDAAPVMLALMLNPSTADHEKLDPTVTRMVTRAARLGFGELLVANLYALRSTSPKALVTHPDPVGPWNDAAITACAKRAATIVVGWGVHASDERVAKVVALLRGIDRMSAAVCLGTTANGKRHAATWWVDAIRRGVIQDPPDRPWLATPPTRRPTWW